MAVTSLILASSAAFVTGYSRIHQWIIIIHCCSDSLDLSRKLPVRIVQHFLQELSEHPHLYVIDHRYINCLWLYVMCQTTRLIAKRCGSLWGPTGAPGTARAAWQFLSFMMNTKMESISVSPSSISAPTRRPATGQPAQARTPLPSWVAEGCRAGSLISDLKISADQAGFALHCQTFLGRKPQLGARRRSYDRRE